jgi:hypothetical protein
MVAGVELVARPAWAAAVASAAPVPAEVMQAERPRAAAATAAMVEPVAPAAKAAKAEAAEVGALEASVESPATGSVVLSPPLAALST